MVLFVCYSGVLGGAERLLVDFAGALDAECAVACPEGPLARVARERGMRVLPLPARTLHMRRDRLLTLLRIVSHAPEVRALIRPHQPDSEVG